MPITKEDFATWQDVADFANKICEAGSGHEKAAIYDSESLFFLPLILDKIGDVPEQDRILSCAATKLHGDEENILYAHSPDETELIALW